MLFLSLLVWLNKVHGDKYGKWTITVHPEQRDNTFGHLGSNVSSNLFRDKALVDLFSCSQLDWFYKATKILIVCTPVSKKTNLTDSQFPSKT